MKKSGILNSGILSALGNIGHKDLIVISDAGLPIPDTAVKIDLAIEQDYPDIVRVLKLISEEFLYEKIVVAAEQKDNNPMLYSKISSVITNCPISLEDHQTLLSELLPKAKYVIRTGSFEPWGNVFLFSGINAPIWFSKEGVKTPKEYRDIIDSFE